MGVLSWFDISLVLIMMSAVLQIQAGRTINVLPEHDLPSHIVVHSPECPHGEWNKHPTRQTHCLPGTTKCFSSVRMSMEEKSQMILHVPCVHLIQSDQLILSRQSTTPPRRWNSSMKPWHLNENRVVKPPLKPFNTTVTPQWRPVTVFVLDDGIDATHQEFQPGQVVPGYDFVNQLDKYSMKTPNATSYHGTHIAGTIAGERVGLAAPDTTLVDLRVIDENVQRAHFVESHLTERILSVITKLKKK